MQTQTDRKRKPKKLCRTQKLTTAHRRYPFHKRINIRITRRKDRPKYTLTDIHIANKLLKIILITPDYSIYYLTYSRYCGRLG